MTNQVGHPDSPQDPAHVLYVSLLILGLDPVALEHKLKTPVNQKCFCRINRRLGDAILHFLFVCLDREKAGKIFRDCWPVLDKKHESQFYKAAFEWYKSLQQSYRQPVPTVMTKTFMAPGGPRFTSTLMTLARTALYTLITKRGPSCTLLNTPNHSRSPEQNWQTLKILQAFKVAHSQNYVGQQKIRQSVLVTLKKKARELCSKYRRLCKEGERASVEFFEALNSNERLAQHQKDIFASASSGTIQKAILGDISRMNDSVSRLWIQVDQYQQVEESAWKVLCPLLDGSTSLSHISGSIYSPQVPEMVYKIHANAINKLKLQGLYREGKLDLLSLVQYSTLALTSLLDTARNTDSHSYAESDKIKAQAGQVTSLGETVSELSDKLSTLLPAFNYSFSSSFLSTSSYPTLERIGLAGKPQLCPPTPPFTLLKKSVPLISATHVPLQLTPGVKQLSPRLAKDGFNATPRRLLCDLGKINASRKSPKPNVVYSATTCKDDSVMVNEHFKEDIIEAGLSMDTVTVDIQGQCQRKKELALLSDGHGTYRKEKRCAEMSEDSEILLDAIRDMNITKKWGNLDKSKDFSPHQDFQAECRQSAVQFQDGNPKLILPIDTPNKQSSLQSGQHSQLVDITITPKLFGCSNPLGDTNESPRNIFTSHEKVGEALPCIDQQPSLTSQERKETVIRFERRWKDSIPELQERLHFITQTPVKDSWFPLGTKIPSRFDGLDVSPGSEYCVPGLPSEISCESSNLRELRYHSKARLNLLHELQASSQKYDTSLLQKNPQVTKLKPSFISYVENLKKSHASVMSEKKSFKTERNNKQKTSGNNNTECIVLDTCTNGWPTENVSKEYFDNFTRMQSLLDLDEDSVITNSKSQHAKDWLQQDEVFVTAKEASHQFETQRRLSSILPEASVFDTLIDSILGGELDVSLLTDKNVGKQIRRESLSSRRQSVANMRRLSLESTKHPSEAADFGSEDCSGIFDENDSCLLSTSLEDVGCQQKR